MGFPGDGYIRNILQSCLAAAPTVEEARTLVDASPASKATALLQLLSKHSDAVLARGLARMLNFSGKDISTAVVRGAAASLAITFSVFYLGYPINDPFAQALADSARRLVEVNIPQCPCHLAPAVALMVHHGAELDYSGLSALLEDHQLLKAGLEYHCNQLATTCTPRAVNWLLGDQIERLSGCNWARTPGDNSDVTVVLALPAIDSCYNISVSTQQLSGYLSVDLCVFPLDVDEYERQLIYLTTPRPARAPVRRALVNDKRFRYSPLPLFKTKDKQARKEAAEEAADV